jgi:hypothetical protein
MKKLLFFIATGFFITASAQDNVQYKVLEDNPLRACNFAMGIEMAQLDFGFKNIDGISFSTGVWGFADYKHHVGADYILRYGYLSLGRLRDPDLKSHRQVELGGYLILKKGMVNRTNRVVLKVEKDATTETTTYVMVPSTQFLTTGLRAGLMDYGGVLTMPESESGPDVVNYNVIGFYGGFFKERTRELLISTDKYGKKGISLHSKFFLDAMVAPVSKVSLAGTDYKSAFKVIAVGARMGISWYPVLTRKEARPDFKGRRFMFQAEAGYRPYDGLFLTGTLSIPITRHIEKLSDGSDKIKVDTEKE